MKATFATQEIQCECLGLRELAYPAGTLASDDCSTRHIGIRAFGQLNPADKSKNIDRPARIHDRTLDAPNEDERAPTLDDYVAIDFAGDPEFGALMHIHVPENLARDGDRFDYVEVTMQVSFHHSHDLRISR